MIFFFKKKPIVLHCFTDREEVLGFAPIQKTLKFIPDWWKQLPKVSSKNSTMPVYSTMKLCVGFTDYYKLGVTMPMWCDLALEIGKQGSDYYKYQFSDHRSEIQTHPPAQHNNHFAVKDYQHIKIVTPWAFHCEEDINFMAMEPTWSFMKFETMRTLPGVVSYKHQSGTNINIMIKRTEEKQNILLPFLEPVYHVFPISDRPIKLVVTADINMYDKCRTKNYMSTFVDKYKSNIKARKAAES